MDSRIAQIDEKIGYTWVVRLKENNEFIGTFNLNPFRDTCKIQIGFQMKKRFWNQGYASAGAKRVLEYGIHERGLKTIYGFFEKENVASGKILKKLGFHFEESKRFENEKTTIEVYRFKP